MCTLFAVRAKFWAYRIILATCFAFTAGMNLPAVAQEQKPAAVSKKPAEESATDSKSVGAGNSNKPSSGNRSAKTKKATGKKTQQAKNEQQSGTSNIYDRWSQGVLKNEKSLRDTLHPLAEKHPDQFVVVCEAGCDGPRDHIVAMKPKGTEASTDQQAQDASSGVETPNTDITCVGGCYESNTYENGAYDDYYDDTDWVTSDGEEGPNSSPAKVEKRWYERIN